MPADVVVGLQFGDEGKGKLVDRAVSRGDYQVVARYQGGPNAGHSVCRDGKEYAFHLIPSGILQPRVRNVLGNGVVTDLHKLVEEIDGLDSRGVTIDKSNFYISDRAHIILDSHKKEDQSPLSMRIGTTKSGMGAVHRDKAERSGIRICDLQYIHRSDVKDRIEETLKEKYPWSDKLKHPIQWSRGEYDTKKILYSLGRDFERIKPYVTDTAMLLNNWLGKGDNVLLEGAQATLLDLDHGTYPYVTSSNPTIGGAQTGSGIGHKHIRRVTGVMKAYTTRVGNGPFPTEMHPEEAERIRTKGNEYGTTTRRERRCGWLDMPALEYATKINGLTDIALTKVDVLSGMSEIPIGECYTDLDGVITTSFPASVEILADYQVQFHSIWGWREINHPQRRLDIPHQLNAYMKYIEDKLQTPIKFLSFGRNNEESLEL